MSEIQNIENSWTEKLEIAYRGQIKNTPNNVRLIIENDPQLSKIFYDELSRSYYVKGKLPWRDTEGEWRDEDMAHLSCYLDDNYCCFSNANLSNGFVAAVDNRHFHPVKEYLESIRWDGKQRLETLFIDWLGAEDNKYVREATKIAFVAAVMRIYIPGLKFDNVIVLNGPQGIGKSTLLAKMGGNWYSDSLTMSDMNDKTAAEKLQGSWIIEIGEMAGIRKADMEKVKAFISRQDDKYRVSYAKTVSSHPRQCVFFGTTNAESGYLRDITGNRRFWNIDVKGSNARHPFNISKHDVEQVWAEAVQLAFSGMILLLSDEAYKLSVKAQNEAMEYDEREGLIRKYLETPIPEDWSNRTVFEKQEYLSNDNELDNSNTHLRKYVCNLEIWTECFGQSENRLTKYDSYQIASIMKRIGNWSDCSKQKYYKQFGNQRSYCRIS